MENLGRKDVHTQQGVKMQDADSVWGGLTLELDLPQVTFPPRVLEQQRGQRRGVTDPREPVSSFCPCLLMQALCICLLGLP